MDSDNVVGESVVVSLASENGMSNFLFVDFMDAVVQYLTTKISEEIA